MADSKIPLSDLPAGVPGAYDKVAGVDTATGASRLFPMPQAGVPKAYATRASLPAAGGLTAGTAAWVTNDPNPLLNGTWSVQAGAWVQSADRVTGLEGRVSSVELKAGATGMSYPNPNAINLDLNAGLLKITASQVRVFYGRSSFLLAGQDVALPSSRQRIIANVTTGEVSFTTATTTPSTHVVLGSYDNIERKLVGFPPHFVNGALDRVPTFGRLASLTDGGVVFDLTARQMILATRLVTPNSALTLNATVPFPSNSTAPYRLERTPGASTPVAFVASSATSNPRAVIFGFVRVQADRVDVYGIDQYTVTGGPPPAQAPLSIYEGTLVSPLNPQHINFDWNAGFLRISASQVRCLYGRSAPLLPAQDMELPSQFDNNIFKIYFSVTTGLLSWAPASNALQPVDTVIVGVVRATDRAVYGIPEYYENGLPVVVDDAPLAARELLAIDGPTSPGFLLPGLLPDFKSFASAVNVDHTTAYDLYDGLMAAYPDYISKVSLGPDSNGNVIYRYDLKPATAFSSGTGKPAKMILISGVHGHERAGVYCLYSALKQVCERWQSDERLDTLRWNCHFIVIPMANPYGFEAYSRKNENGVDLARNFTERWASGQSDPAHDQYRGPAPLSENAAQYMDAVMSANTDAIYCGSFHNMTSGPDGKTLIWNASATTIGVRLAQRLIYKLSRVWKSQYAWLPQDTTSLLGYSDPSAPVGSEGLQSTATYGIQGGTFEISRAVPLAPDPDGNSAYANTLGTETIVNWLLMNLEHGAALYNGRGR